MQYAPELRGNQPSNAATLTLPPPLPPPLAHSERGAAATLDALGRGAGAELLPRREQPTSAEHPTSRTAERAPRLVQERLLRNRFIRPQSLRFRGPNAPKYH